MENSQTTRLVRPAMVGVPRCIVPGPGLRLPVPAGDELPEGLADPSADSLEELFAPLPPVRFLRDQESQLLETTAGLRLHRALEPDEPWTGPAGSEQRLLDQVDALLRSSPAVVANLQERLEDELDPDLVFALVFALGCTSELRNLEAGLATLAPQMQDEEVFAAVEEALGLCPHPDLKSLLVPWLGEPEAPLRRAALMLLSSRGELTDAQALRALGDPDASVVCAAAAAMRWLDSRTARACTSLLAHEDENVLRAALQTLSRHGLAEAQTTARRLCLEQRYAFADAAMFVALWGAASDLELIRTIVRTDPTAAAVAGRFGHAETIELLIGLLTSPGAGDPLVVARALDRLTGAELTEEVPLPEEDEGVADPDIAAEEEEEVLEPNAVAVPTPDAERWWHWWLANRQRLDPAIRWRRGRPHGPAALLDELLTGPADPRERAWTALEFAMRIRRPIPAFAAGDPVARQQATLQRWQEAVRTGDFWPPEGRWT